MIVPTFFKQVAKQWTDEQQCGECWVSSAPLSVQAMNNYAVREGEECCVHIFVTRYNIRTVETRHPVTKLVNSTKCVHDFDLYFVKQTDFGTHVDNEQIGYEEDESLIAEILDPISECIGCGREFDLCSMGWDFDISQWSMTPAIREQDFNWTGWRVAGTFEVNVVPMPIRPPAQT